MVQLVKNLKLLSPESPSLAVFSPGIVGTSNCDHVVYWWGLLAR